MPKTLRTFIAIEFSSGFRQQLGETSQKLAEVTPGRAVNWVKPALIHITLKFLGDTAESALPDITTALTRAVAKSAPFHLTTGQAGCFPNPRRPRVVWVGLDDEPAGYLGALQRAIEDAIAPLGFPTEDRAFSPHITLGRVRRETSPAQAAIVGQAVSSLGPLAPRTEAVDAVVLMQSVLGASGPAYSPLYRAVLTRK